MKFIHFFLFAMLLCGQGSITAQDTAFFNDGTELTYRVLENKADETDPFYFSVIPNYSDVRAGVSLNFCYYSPQFGIVEANPGFGLRNQRPIINKVGAQTWIFLFQKRVQRKNSITVGRRGVYVGANESVYKDYLTVVEAEKNRSLALHLSFFRKTYRGIDPYYWSYSIESGITNEIACGLSFIANSHQKWELTYAGGKTYGETSLYRLTFDFLYYMNGASVTLQERPNGNRPEAPQELIDELFVKQTGFRFLAEANVPVRASRLDYGFVFQAGVISTPFDGSFEEAFFPIIGVGWCIRPNSGKENSGK